MNYFDSTWLENTPYYDSRVVIYDRRGFIRLATGLQFDWFGFNRFQTGLELGVSECQKCPLNIACRVSMKSNDIFVQKRQVDPVLNNFSF